MYVRILAAAEAFTKVRRPILDFTSSLIKQENAARYLNERIRFSVSVIAVQDDSRGQDIHLFAKLTHEL